MTALKTIWGVLITLLTLVLLYGQYQVERTTLRPSLAISYRPATEKFYAMHGPYSHSYVIENSGSVPAKRATITVITRQGGSTPHRDENRSLGDVMPNQKLVWVNHVHGIVEDAPGRPKYQIVEDIEITYIGKSVLRFWCDPIYSLRGTFVYDEKEVQWVHHTEKRIQESVYCG
jgi:hypothetical protein